MPPADRTVSRRRGGRIEFDLEALRAWFGDAVTRLLGAPVEPGLLRARLADRCRDAGLAPVLPEEFAERTTSLDEEGWRRLALSASALEMPGVLESVPGLCGERAVGDWLEAAFFAPARELHLLTMELLSQSALRVEEFARQFVHRAAGAVRGETEEQSRQQLHRLDYARLLSQAERARTSAEERLEATRRPGRAKK
jgi:hypothetical protein